MALIILIIGRLLICIIHWKEEMHLEDYYYQLNTKNQSEIYGFALKSSVSATQTLIVPSSNAIKPLEQSTNHLEVKEVYKMQLRNIFLLYLQ